MTPEREVFLELRSARSGVQVSGWPSGTVGDKVVVDGREDGIFAEWRWDGRQLELRGDRYGMCPLYWARSGNTFRLSSSIPALIHAGAGSALDEAAFAVFLRLGFFIGDDTPFRSIRALPPAARITWTADGFDVESRLPSSRPVDIDRQLAVQRYGELFSRAIERRATRSAMCVLPLSGGQDSRHILFQLLESGCPPSLCVSARYHPPRATPDAEVAREVALLTGVRHRVLAQPASQLETLLRHFRATNLCTLTPGSFLLAVADFVAGQDAVVYDGIGGDVLSAGLFATPQRQRLYREGRLEALAGDLLSSFDGGGGYPERTLESLLDKANLRRFGRQAAVQRMVRELERHAEMPNPLLSFCFFNRTRRDIALLPFRVLAGASCVCTPYLDAELVDFLSSLPAGISLDHEFHKQTIAQRFPQWAHLPFAQWVVTDDRHARAHFRRFSTEVAGYTRAGLADSWLRRSWVLSRLTRCVADAHYSKAIAWLGPLLVYLHQLQGLILEGELGETEPPALQMKLQREKAAPRDGASHHPRSHGLGGEAFARRCE